MSAVSCEAELFGGNYVIFNCLASNPKLKQVAIIAAMPVLPRNNQFIINTLDSDGVGTTIVTFTMSSSTGNQTPYPYHFVSQTNNAFNVVRFYL